MAVARKFIDKKVLYNYIRSTDAHNKIREEQDMWRLRQAQNTQKSDCLASLAATSKRRGRLHSDEPLDSGERNTYWMKQLTEFESSCTDRWGHSGYKELYPEEFASDFADSDDDSEDEKKKKKNTSKKRKKSSSKDERKSKSKKIRTVQSSDSETKLNQEKRKRRKRTKDKTSRKSKTEKRKKKRTVKDSDTGSCSSRERRKRMTISYKKSTKTKDKPTSSNKKRTSLKRDKRDIEHR